MNEYDNTDRRQEALSIGIRQNDTHVGSGPEPQAQRSEMIREMVRFVVSNMT